MFLSYWHFYVASIPCSQVDFVHMLNATMCATTIKELPDREGYSCPRSAESIYAPWNEFLKFVKPARMDEPPLTKKQKKQVAGVKQKQDGEKDVAAMKEKVEGLK